MLARMSTKGQLVIPAEVRRALALEPDTAFRVEVHGEVIHLCPVRPAREDWRALQGSLGVGASMTRALEAERASEVARDASREGRGR